MVGPLCLARGTTDTGGVKASLGGGSPVKISISPAQSEDGTGTTAGIKIIMKKKADICDIILVLQYAIMVMFV